jgi:hypothetical protein
MIKHLIEYLIYSQIWLKLPKDDRPPLWLQTKIPFKKEQQVAQH